ncbi:SOS response-associated peptidase family protein [Ideonella livida]|uniref:Abasic site processing protein n=1 Tax=Ideonella livida TaxID=2707176 RepID=A0A7C9TNE0_9BURK|nr:SOS response-associated peptidase family protein [Ideonella livida]NDY93743.1 hypothetical protein [Ideonella livida]
MCYSAQVTADYRQYVQLFGATLSPQDFYSLYFRKAQGEKLRTPLAMDRALEQAPPAPPAGDGPGLVELIAQLRGTQAQAWEQELFRQRKRLADAQRVLATGRPTKKAQEDERIASAKVPQLLGWLADLRRTEPQARDARIYPGWYLPVMVWEDGQRVVKPMRYQCRPAGKPALYDQKYPGTYNARRDNLQGFWKGQFGHQHGVVLVSAFYENVARHAAEGRDLRPGETPENTVLEFRPQPAQDMLVACLWSRWQAPAGSDEADLLSFAAITDEPPPEVAAAGHDRCIIPLKPEHLDTWLRPNPRDLATQQALLDDRERPWYAHRLAA